MTTYAYRNGVLAADSGITGSEAHIATCTKITKIGPYLLGAAGTGSICKKLLDWFNMGMKGDAPDLGKDDTYSSGHLFCPDGLHLRLEPSGLSIFRSPYSAGGSGVHFALGAMAAGASAEEAVAAAIKHDLYSRGPICVLRSVV